MTLKSKYKEFKKIVEKLSEPYEENPDGSVEYSAIESRQKEVAEKLRGVTTGQPEELFSFIVQHYKDEGDSAYDELKASVSALSMLDGVNDYLCQLALMENAPWYVRVDAIDALNDTKDKEFIRNLIPIVDAKIEEGEIRAAALRALSLNGFDEIMPIIYRLEADEDIEDHWYGAQEKLLAARGCLGDETVLPELIALCYDDWSHRQIQGQVALDAFIENKGGLRPVLAILNPTLSNKSENEGLQLLADKGSTNHIQRWAIDKLSELSGDSAISTYLSKLGDVDWGVSMSACQALCEYNDEISPPLVNVIKNSVQPRDKRLWALATALRVKIAVSPDDYRDLEDIYVPWSFECPEGVRDLLIKEYVPDSEPGTDIRYLIEYELLDDTMKYDEAGLRSNLLSELKKSGLKAKVSDCGRYHGSGGGTFDVFDIGKAQFFLCTLGPYAVDSNIIEYDELGNAMKVDNDKLEKVRSIAESVGVKWLKEDQLGDMLPGLNVYFFGSREPLNLMNLLFYWQD